MMTPPLLSLLLAGLLPLHADYWLISHDTPLIATPPTQESVYAWVSSETKVPIPIIENQHGSLIRLALLNTPVLQTYIQAPIRHCHALGNAFVSRTQTRIFIKTHTLLCATDQGSIARKFEGELFTGDDGVAGIPILPLAPHTNPHDQYYLLTETIQGILHVQSPPRHP